MEGLKFPIYCVYNRAFPVHFRPFPRPFRGRFRRLAYAQPPCSYGFTGPIDPFRRDPPEFPNPVRLAYGSCAATHRLPCALWRRSQNFFSERCRISAPHLHIVFIVITIAYLRIFVPVVRFRWQKKRPRVTPGPCCSQFLNSSGLIATFPFPAYLLAHVYTSLWKEGLSSQFAIISHLFSHRP